MEAITEVDWNKIIDTSDEEELISPTDMCKCGSLDVTFLDEHGEAYQRYELYECDKCDLIWVVKFTLSGVIEV